MKLVYRLENNEGVGPHRAINRNYMNEKFIEEELLLHNNFSKYPPGNETLPGILKSIWFCSSDSLEELFYWFSKELIAYLQEYGFNITIYKVRNKSYKRGCRNKQSFFVKKEAKFIKTIDIFSLF